MIVCEAPVNSYTLSDQSQVFSYHIIVCIFAFGCNALYSHYEFLYFFLHLVVMPCILTMNCIAFLYFFNFAVYYSCLYAMFFLFFLYKSPAACITNIIF